MVFLPPCGFLSKMLTEFPIIPLHAEYPYYLIFLELKIRKILPEEEAPRVKPCTVYISPYYFYILLLRSKYYTLHFALKYPKIISLCQADLPSSQLDILIQDVMDSNFGMR
jgi:hypothetical protein